MTDQTTAEHRRAELEKFSSAKALILEVDRITRQLTSVAERASDLEIERFRSKGREFPPEVITQMWTSAVVELRRAAQEVPVVVRDERERR